jgi:hypothetical protein
VSRLDQIEARYKSATDDPWKVLDERGIEFLTGVIGADFPNAVELLRISFDRFNEAAQPRSSNRGEPASD